MADDYFAQGPEAGPEPATPQGRPAPQPGPQAGDPGGAPGTIPHGPGYVMDPVTGQLFFTVPVQPGPGACGPGIQPDMAGMRGGAGPAMAGGPVPPGAMPAGAAAPGADQKEAPQRPGPDYGEVIRSVEQFAEGEASVGDVVKTLYTNTAQDDQFWKGALVGAAAAVLLTSGPVKETMGKTFGSLFGKSGHADSKAAGAATPEDKKE